MAQFKYLGTTVAYQKLIKKKIKSGLNSGNTCSHSLQNLLYICLLSRNVKIRICITIIFPVVLYGSTTWSPSLREEHKQNRVLRRIFGPMRDEVAGG
jgi:hypothetical protein